MARFSVAHRGLVGVGLVAALVACSGDLTTPTDTSAGTVTTPTGTPAGPVTTPTDTSAGSIADTTGLSALAVGSLRVRCERRSGRSKISVDGNNLSPRNGTFSARVRASGGTVGAPARRAVGDEAEFDFDSNRNDVAAGATRISATFIGRQPGPDVVGEILNSQGGVVARQGVECEFR